MTTPTEDSIEDKLSYMVTDFVNAINAIPSLPENDDEIPVMDAFETAIMALLLTQQQVLLERIDTEVIGEDARIDIPGASITNTANRHENELRTEQRKALQRIKGELGEGQ